MIIPVPDFVLSMIVVLVVPVVVQLLKYWQVKRGEPLTTELVTFLVAALAVAGGVILFVVSPEAGFPVWEGDPIAYLNALLPVASGLFGVITLFYNLILKRVFEALGLSTSHLEPEPQGPAG
jgi:hypothetical protein